MNYEQLLQKIYSDYPRQFGSPQRKNINSFAELMQNIERHNKKTPCFVSLYNYYQLPDRSYNKDIKLKFVLFDFDENPYENAKKLFDYLKEKNIKFFIVFSGGGFHFYIITDNYTKVVNAKMALLNCHKQIIKDTGLVCDNKIIGNVAQIIRIPATLNEKPHRSAWCIFVNEEMFLKGYDFVKDYSKNNKFGSFQVIGEKYLDILPFDTNKLGDIEVLALTDVAASEIKSDALLSRIDPCIANLLMQIKEMGSSFSERYLIISYLKDFGFSKNQVIEVLRKFLEESKFNHCVYEEKQVDYIFSRNLISAGCSQIQQKGYCVGGTICKKF